MPCGKLRIRYELLRSLGIRYVSLRNERIVADGLYVSSAEHTLTDSADDT